MILRQLKAGTALLKISKDEKRKIFETDIETDNGDVISFFKAMEAGSETDEYYSQSVYVADVIQVAGDVDNLKVGDVVVVDYMADSAENKVAYYEGEEKVILLDVNTIFHTDDKIAFASMNSRMDTYTWRKGDVDTQSWIYAILRDGILAANNDYVLLEHKNLTWLAETKSGFSFFETEGDMVIRKVIASSPGSGVKVGDIIVVETYALLERSVQNFNFDIIMNIDILGSILI